MNSIMPGDKKGACYLCCKENVYTEVHHIFGGTANRKKSDRAGLTVHLCYECHRGNKGAHKNKRCADYLHMLGQFQYEQLHSHDEFMQLFGKNYIQEGYDVRD